MLIAAQESNTAQESLATVSAKGKAVHAQSNWQGRGYGTFVIAAPIVFRRNGLTEDGLFDVIVKRTQDGQSYYLHEVYLSKEKRERIAPPFLALTPVPNREAQ